MVEDDWTIFGGVVFEIDIILICVYVLNECHVKEDAFSYKINFKNWPSLIKSSFKMQVYKYIYILLIETRLKYLLVLNLLINENELIFYLISKKIYTRYYRYLLKSTSIIIVE